MTYTAKTGDCNAVILNQEIIITMPSHFTALEVDSLQQYFQTICKTKNSSIKIFLDFSQTTFMDSNGLIALCRIIHKARSSEVKLFFNSFSSQVKMILSLTGLDEVIKVEDGDPTANEQKTVVKQKYVG